MFLLNTTFSYFITLPLHNIRTFIKYIIKFEFLFYLQQNSYDKVTNNNQGNVTLFTLLQTLLIVWTNSCMTLCVLREYNVYRKIKTWNLGNLFEFSVLLWLKQLVNQDVDELPRASKVDEIIYSGNGSV